MTAIETEPISDLFEGGGLLLRPAADAEVSLRDLDRDEIIASFEAHGVLLFRGFGLRPEDLTAFTDSFSEMYCPDLASRAPRFGQAAVRSVDRGSHAIRLHVEAGFAVTAPELLWFYCHVPSTTGGSTTLCDGIRLWRSLAPETQRRFLAQPVKYRFSFVFGEQKPGEGRVPWPMPGIGVDGYVDRDEGMASLSVLRYAVQESRLADRSLCFANFLLPEAEILTRTMADGSPIGEKTLAELADTAERLSFDLQWQPGDLVMVDNRRFMHGRRAFDAGHDPRDIVQIQTASASFAYGATTRGTRVPEAPTAPVTVRRDRQA